MSDRSKRKLGEESPNTISPARADKKIAANGRPRQRARCEQKRL